MLINRQPRWWNWTETWNCGVIQDYSFLSLKDEVQPVATFYDTELDNMIINFRKT
jgi:putative ABC transport system permease protein